MLDLGCVKVSWLGAASAKGTSPLEGGAPMGSSGTLGELGSTGKGEDSLWCEKIIDATLRITKRTAPLAQNRLTTMPGDFNGLGEITLFGVLGRGRETAR